MIWQPEFTDKTLSRKIGAVQEQLSRISSEFEPSSKKRRKMSP
nr:DUF4756 family protein [Escherichia coli]